MVVPRFSVNISVISFGVEVVSPTLMVVYRLLVGSGSGTDVSSTSVPCSATSIPISEGFVVSFRVFNAFFACSSFSYSFVTLQYVPSCMIVTFVES